MHTHPAGAHRGSPQTGWHCLPPGWGGMVVHRTQGLREAAGFQSDSVLQPVYTPKDGVHGRREGKMRSWQGRACFPSRHSVKHTSCFSFFSGGPANSSGCSLQREQKRSHWRESHDWQGQESGQRYRDNLTLAQNSWLRRDRVSCLGALGGGEYSRELAMEGMGESQASKESTQPEVEPAGG